MIELLAIYKFAFVLAFLAGVSLSLQGTHLIARKESLQVLAMAQGGLLGNLLGRLFVPESELATILSSLALFLILKIVFIFVKVKRSSKETFFIVIYISLLALGYLLTSLFPGLEGHMSVGFFGDIVSLSEKMTLVLIGLFLIFTILLITFHRSLFRRTFEKSIFGIESLSILEEILFAFVFVCALYGLGVLFSVASMIFPAVIIGTSGKSLKVVLLTALGVTSISSILGLGSSIIFERLSTVPGQIIIMLLFLFLSSNFIKKFKKQAL